MKRAYSVIVAGVAVILLSLPLAAQTQLFNIPTSDVADAGSRYLEADFDTHLSSYRTGGFHGFGFVGVYGLHKRVEIGLNGYVYKDIDGWSPVELQPNIKFQLYSNDKTGISVAAGAIGYVPLSRRSAGDSIVNVYAAAGKRFKGKYGTSVTGGAYAIAGRTQDRRYGAIFGIEQPYNERLTFIADWTSGNNRFGYATAGLGLALTKKSTLYGAYYFGNSGRGNNSLGIYYAYSF